MTTMQTEEQQPIVCTLTAGDLKDRLAWIAALNRDALREKRRADLRLELTYAPEAGERVREMVRREQECCAFLDFKLREEPDAVRLTIVAPEGAREAAEMLFEPFQSTGQTVTGCACSASAMTKDAMPSRSAGGLRVGVVAGTAATGALACAACCVLPFAFPAVMLSGAGGVILWLAGAAKWAGGVAFVAVIAGWG